MKAEEFLNELDKMSDLVSIDVEIVRGWCKDVVNNFKSRTCKNCKYFKGSGMIANCSNLEVGVMNDASFITVTEDFGCNKFKRKENERD